MVQQEGADARTKARTQGQQVLCTGNASESMLQSGPKIKERGSEQLHKSDRQRRGVRGWDRPTRWGQVGSRSEGRGVAECMLRSARIVGGWHGMRVRGVEVKIGVSRLRVGQERYRWVRAIRSVADKLQEKIAVPRQTKRKISSFKSQRSTGLQYRVQQPFDRHSRETHLNKSDFRRTSGSSFYAVRCEDDFRKSVPQGKEWQAHPWQHLSRTLYAVSPCHAPVAH